MKLKWSIVIIILMAGLFLHESLRQEFGTLFGPLDPHRRHVLIWWVLGVVGVYLIYEWAGDHIRLWWRRNWR